MQINKEIEEVLLKYKGLEYDQNSNKIYGEIFITEFDSYEIEMELSTYPKLFPKVLEIGDRIPKKMDRHIYPNSGACCFTTLAKSQILLKSKIKSLFLFVRDVLVPYLENNSYYEIENKYFGAEYSHDYMGVIEGYQDILGITDINAIVELIINRLDHKKITIRDDCYCGSGQKLKKCYGGKHDINYRDFRKIDKDILRNDTKFFKAYIDKNKK